MRRKLLIAVGIVFLIGLVIAQGSLIPPGLIEATGPYPLVSCSETDNGPDIYTQGFYPITYLENNTIQNATGNDFCLNSNDLLEGVCSSWVNANLNTNYNTSGFLATFNCSASNNGNQEYGCASGACRQYYDTFSSGGLNGGLWEIRPESPSPAPGIPLFGQYGVINQNGNYVFNTFQPSNSPTSAVYLVPTHHFIPGDVLEYEVNVLDRQTYWGTLVIADSPSSIQPGIYWRIGINGIGVLGSETSNYPYDEIGLSKVRVAFSNNQINLTQISPSNQTYSRIFPIQYGTNGFYELYIGSRIGYSGGGVDADYDNFYVYSNATTQINNTNTTWPLVALWNFDEGNGTTTVDSSGNGNTGTLQNGVAWTNQGYSGNALNLDGVDDYVRVNDSNSLDITQNLVIEAWAKRNSLNNVDVIVQKTNTADNHFAYTFEWGDDNKLYLAINPDDNSGSDAWWEFTNTAFTDTNFHNLKAVFNGATMDIRLYVDGVEQTTVRIGFAHDHIANTAGYLAIGTGRANAQHYFNGIIDEVSIRGN